MGTIELERTFLAKYIPEAIWNCPAKEIADIYLPEFSDHPKLRIRKLGDVFEMTKKEPVEGRDSSRQEEQTITLSAAEFEAFKNIPGKRLRKIRYYWDAPSGHAEVDVFQDALEGLVLIDFEFETIEAKDNFPMPDFCLTEVTQEKFAAGGVLVGKMYSDIEKDLERFGYQKLVRG